MTFRSVFWTPSVLILSPLLIFSIGLNVLQAKRILALVNEDSPTTAGARLVQEGSQLPDLHAMDLEGRPFTLSFHARSNRAKVIYVFSPAKWCSSDGYDKPQ